MTRIITIACAIAASTSTLSGQCLLQEAYSPPYALPYSGFAHSTSVSGGLVAVGAPFGTNPGFVQPLARNAEGSWIPQPLVTASDGAILDQFGYSVAIDGSTLVSGAPADGDLGAKGALYVFDQHPDGSWVETAKITSPISQAWGLGWAVDLDGDRLLVGAKGASDFGGGYGWAFVYERVAGVWTHQATLQPSISIPGDGFGATVDLDGDRLVVGAPYAWTVGTGLAFVFDFDPLTTAWVETAVLLADDADTLDQFGRSVALDGDRVVVGAPLHGPVSLEGAAYVFGLVAGSWVQTQKLSPAGTPVLSYYGWSVALDGNALVVGANRDSQAGPGTGAAYLLEHDGTEWVDSVKLFGSDVSGWDTFSHSLSIDGDTLVGGAPHITGPAPASAFVFSLSAQGPHLASPTESLSLTAGGEQELQLGACLDHAGDLFLLAGTSTGTSPGFLAGGLAVPLNPDAYFFHTINHVGGAPLVNAFGVLDHNGFAKAGFLLAPRAFPSLAGVQLHHAAAILDGQTGLVEAVSSALPITLLP